MSLQKHQLRALNDHDESVQRGLAKPSDFVMPPRIGRKRDNAEWRIQAACFKWWRSYCRTVGIPECLFFHVPNGSMLGNYANERAIRGRMLKLAGLVSGVTDAVLLVPRLSPIARGPMWVHALLVEFKTPQGVLSDDQQIFRAAVVAQGYQHVVAHSAEEAIGAITTYLSP